MKNNHSLTYYALKKRYTTRLLDLNGTSNGLYGSLDLLRLLLGDTLLKGLRRPFNEFLGLLQTEGGDGSHVLNDLDLSGRVET